MNDLKIIEREIKRMDIAAAILSGVLLLIFIVSTVYLIKSIVQPTEEEKDEEVIIYLTEEELAARPLLYEEETEEIEIEPQPVQEEEQETFKYYEEVPLEKKLQYFTQALCKEYSVSYGFFLAMLESESSFDKDAVGDSGKSLGYMQINKPNWERYDLDACMVYDNLEIGIRMLSELIATYDDIDDVVMGYKAGENALKSFKASGTRLSCCDEIITRTIYWNQILDGVKK